MYMRKYIFMQLPKFVVVYVYDGGAITVTLWREKMIVKYFKKQAKGLSENFTIT